MDKKNDPDICCLHETHLRTNDMHKLKVRGWKKILHANGNEKEIWDDDIYIRQNILQNKAHNKRQRRTLHNTEGINPT